MSKALCLSHKYDIVFHVSIATPWILTWNPASLDGTSVIHFVEPGPVELTASADTFSASLQLEVRPNPVARVQMPDAPARLRTGDVIAMAPALSDERGDPVTDAAVSYGVEGPAAYVDIAGNNAVKEQVHLALGDRLTDSVLVGGTHKGAGVASGEIVGPAARFFFIPDVAEAAGHEAFHARFADAWAEFKPWIEGRISLSSASGLDAIVATYRSVLSDNPDPAGSPVLSW